jgi:hypothetical protein
MMPEAKMLRRALDGDLTVLLRSGLNPGMLRPPYDKVFPRLIDFYQKHNQLPGDKRFLDMCQDVSGFEIAPKEQAVSVGTVYWEQISDFVMKQNFIGTMREIAERYNDKTVPATELCLEAAAKLRKIYVDYGTGDTQLIPGKLVEPILWNEYQLAAEGKKPGIPISPLFPSLANGIVTWAPASITTVVSRSGVGKTWFMLINGLNAACMGYRVLGASMEMIAEDVYERLISLHARINFDDLIKGKLARDQFERYNQCRADIRADAPPWNNIRLMNPDSIKSVEAVEAQADASGAHFVLADAFYDIPEKTREKEYEQINENLRAVRRFSLSTKRHWMLTAQFNRSAKTAYDSDEFAMGGTDYFNKISNNVIMMVQSKTQKQARKVTFKLSKGRKASPQPMYEHHWNFFVPTWEPIRAIHERDKVQDQKIYS